MKFKDENIITKHVAEDLDIPEELVIFVVRDFWNTLRSYLTNPLTSKAGILLLGFGNFYLSQYTIDKAVASRPHREDFKLIKQHKDGCKKFSEHRGSGYKPK